MEYLSRSNTEGTDWFYLRMAKRTIKKNPHPNSEEKLKKIGERMRMLRIDAGYTSYELFAYEINVGRAQYWKYENGLEDLKFSSLHKVLDGLEVSFEDFFKGI